MAFIANTAFEVKVSNHEFDSVANITGQYVVSGDPADCSAGILCVKDELLQNEGYPTGVLNGNTWQMVAYNPTGAEDINAAPVYACNPFNVQEIGDGHGNNYKVGHRTLGLGIPAGERDTFTQIRFDGAHMYRFGEGNLTAAYTNEAVLTLAADGKLTPAASATAGTPYFKVVGTGTFTEGASEGFGYIDAIACYAHA